MTRQAGCRIDVSGLREDQGSRYSVSSLTLLTVLKSVDDSADRLYSYVFLCTKALPDIIPNSRLLAPLLTPEYAKQHGQPVYVLVQNGLNVERDL